MPASAPGNRATDTARTGYALRFMGDDVRYKEAPGMNRRVFNPELSEGAPMDSEQYPVVFHHQPARAKSRSFSVEPRNDPMR